MTVPTGSGLKVLGTPVQTEDVTIQNFEALTDGLRAALEQGATDEQKLGAPRTTQELVAALSSVMNSTSDIKTVIQYMQPALETTSVMHTKWDSVIKEHPRAPEDYSIPQNPSRLRKLGNWLAGK